MEFLDKNQTFMSIPDLASEFADLIISAKDFKALNIADDLKVKLLWPLELK